MNPFESAGISHLPLESVVLTMLVPRESINISATPSLSLILKHTTYAVTYPQTRVYLHESIIEKTQTLSYTAQCNGLNELPLIFLKTSWSNNTSTHASYPKERERGKDYINGVTNRFLLQTGTKMMSLKCFSTVVTGPVQWSVALVVSEVCLSV